MSSSPPASNLLMGDRSPLYVDVIVPRRLHRPFTYVVPSTLRSEMAVGQRVLVPFGSATLHAIVVALCDHPPVGTPRKRLKEVLSLSRIDQSEEAGSSQLHLSQWLSERYLAPRGQCVKLLLPPAASSKKPRTVYVLTTQGQQAAAHSENLPPGERKILQRLMRHPSGLTRKTFQGPDPDSSLPSRIALLGKGWIVEREVDKKTTYGPAMQQERQPESPVEYLDRSPIPHPLVRNAQPQFLKELRGGLDVGSPPVVILQASSNDRLSCLIHGVGELLYRKRRVLVVAGEVDRAKEMVETLRNTNHTNIVLIHSGLSVRARAVAWQAAQSDATDVVVGTRSSIFAPLRNIGLIWVEGEDSPALKEERVPRYHARDVARHRATLEKAALVLASSHPSLECIRSVELNHANHVIVPNPSAPSNIEVVDLRDFPRGTLLTPPMLDGIRQAMASGSLVTLYLNRKGYASLVCRACGQVPRCASCSLALSFHKKASSLTCHSCGYVAALPEVCTACHAPRLEPVGAGTERIEESLRQCFPHVRIGRMDRNTIQRESQVDALGTLIRAGEIDIMIGTQMLFPRGRLPLAGFVGILNADTSLHRPDFRSTERTYHALQDAVALCRPGNEGKVMIQTILPNHHVIAAVVERNPALFLRPELEFRRALDYPPFCHLIQLTISGRLENRVKEVAEKWVSALYGEIAAVSEKKDNRELAAGDPATSPAPEPVTVLGPTPAPVPRLRQRHHWHVLVKSRSQEDVRHVVQATLSDMEQLSRRGDLKLTVDVDPISML